jgi:hypothetical protein
MFDSSSRYFTIENARHPAPGGVIVYKKRRFLPQGSALPENRGAIVRVGDRLDTIAARMLGDPLQFWRIADANEAMNPFGLAEPGRFLKIPTARLGNGSSS